MLEKNALKELIKVWNSSNKNVVGIGLFFKFLSPKTKYLQKMLDKNVCETL